VTKLDYKLLALDLDGTLIDDSLVITEPTKKAIAQAIERGVVVTLATGRMFRSALIFARELNLAAPLICYQGAMVRHSTTGETVFHQSLPFDQARAFIELAQKRNLHVNAYVDDHIYVAEMNEAASYYANLARVPAEVVGNLLNFIDRPEKAPTKLVIVTKEEQTLAVVEEFQATFANSLYVTRSHARFTEAVHPECSKGIALKALAQSLNIPIEQVMAIGDNLNDLPMLETAGLSIAVANAGPVVKATAGYVTQGEVSEGVIEAINRFILGNN
jgi:Cof subfamily protein (haloacid dehalogenase superfamily)